MVGYKLSNNDWVTPFFVIFRSVREILLVTVFLEHPVSFHAPRRIFLFFIDVKKHSEGLSKKKRKNPKFDLAPKEGGETPSRISKL